MAQGFCKPQTLVAKKAWEGLGEERRGEERIERRGEERRGEERRGEERRGEERRGEDREVSRRRRIRELQHADWRESLDQTFATARRGGLRLHGVCRRTARP